MPGNHWSVYPSPFDLQNSSTIVWEWIWTSKAIHILEENSSDLTTKVLGLDIAKGQVQEIILRWVDISQVPGLAVPGGTWFTRVVQTGANNSAYSLFRWAVAKVFSQDFFLLSCALAPGFDQRDFKARKLSELQSGNRGWNQRRSKIWLLMILYSCSDQIWSNLILQTKNLETFGCFYSLANVLLCCLFVVTGTLYTDNKSTPAATSSFCFKVDKSKFHFFLGISTAAVFVVCMQSGAWLRKELVLSPE